MGVALVACVTYEVIRIEEIIIPHLHGQDRREVCL